ncbi:MAG TPA: hypothetical protein VKW08_16930 [Xanthobacteraceae bacterium]|jgi:hypothetical protein|nr:hypothetical protein [Xanthobacteraceae bacterium]
MATHKFMIGQTVFLQPTVLNRLAVPRAFAVTKHLPVQKDGQLEYRIRSSSEPFERVAKESDLSVE